MSGPITGKRTGLPLPSTTLMLIRRARGSMEVLLLKRPAGAAFGGAWVFPGGLLDDQDHDPLLYRRCLGIDDARASRALSLSRNGLAYWLAAIRETFEEAGLLMAVNGCGQALRGTVADRLGLLGGRIGFAELCGRGNWCLPANRLHYVAHWITPSMAPRRFSTRFFVAAAPQGATARADGREVLKARWFSPGLALQQKIQLAHPTRHFLRLLTGLGSVEKALDWAGGLDRRFIAVTRPEVRRIDGKLMSCLPTGEVLGPFNMQSYPVGSHQLPSPAAADDHAAGSKKNEPGGESRLQAV